MIEIRRDEWGVPHVFADDTAGLYWGVGFALAEDRLFQIDMARRAFTGRVAEVLGAAYLGHDQSVRAGYDPASIRAQLDALGTEERSIFTAYAAGFNARVDEVLADPATLLPAEYTHYDFRPEPFTDADVAMLWIGSLANRFSDVNSELLNLALLNDLEDMHGPEKARAIFDSLKWRNDARAPTTIRDEDRAPRPVDRAYPKVALRPLSPEARARVRAEADRRARNEPAAPTASNIWILAPSRTTDGSTMLLNGPQFGWFAPAYVWAVGLHTPGLDIVGNTPYGYPCLLFASNGTIAWGSTAGPGKVVDLYQEETDPTDPLRYRHTGAWHRMTTRSETIQVRGATPVTIEVHSTLHGPVTLFDAAQNTAYAKRRAWAGREVESLLGWVQLMRATDWDGFLAASARIAISINFYFADRAGNIGYRLVGHYPDRPASQDTRLPSRGTGEMEWASFHPFDWNPKVLNPRSGLVANWNNKVSADHDNTDTYLWGAADRLSEIHAVLGDARHDPASVWDTIRATSTTDLTARALVPILLAAAPDHPAAAVLAAWNGDEAHEGHAIMRALLPALMREIFGRDLPPRELAAMQATHPPPGFAPLQSPNITPAVKALVNVLAPDPSVPRPHDFLAGRTHAQAIRPALDAALAALGPRPWRIAPLITRFRSTDFMGIPMGLPTAQPELAHFMNRGTENNLVRFAASGTSVEDVTPPGQSGFTAPDGTPAPHARDQLALYGAHGRKRQHLTAEDARANTTAHRSFPPPA